MWLQDKIHIQIYKGTRTLLFVKHGYSVTELPLAGMWGGVAVMTQLNLTLFASTAVVDCSVLGHARAATTHIATGCVDVATHRARVCQAWVLVGA